MGQILHGTATTTHATRAKIQEAEASIRELGQRYNINPKTVCKWKNRDSVEDLQCGSKPGQGSVLTEVDEAVIIETRRKTLLPLDDLYDVLVPLIPVLTRSNLHRCLQRHGVSRLADLLPPEEKGQTKAFKDYAPGYLHLDTAQINLSQDKWYLFVAIDRATRFVLWNCMITNARIPRPRSSNKPWFNIRPNPTPDRPDAILARQIPI